MRDRVQWCSPGSHCSSRSDASSRSTKFINGRFGRLNRLEGVRYPPARSHGTPSTERISACRENTQLVQTRKQPS